MSEEKRKELEVISGDGSSLDISPAYEHLKDAPKDTQGKKPKNIVVPKEITKKKEGGK